LLSGDNAASSPSDENSAFCAHHNTSPELASRKDQQGSLLPLDDFGQKLPFKYPKPKILEPSLDPIFFQFLEKLIFSQN
jgi:hypothetical protein